MKDAVVIGIGNTYRRDDGVGIAVAEEISRLSLPGVRVVTSSGEPGGILDAWNSARLAIIVDAAAGDGSRPGRIRRWTPDELSPSKVVSSHAIGLSDTYALGEAVKQLPDRLVVLTVDVADTDNGVGLTPAVAVAVSAVVGDILAELGDRGSSGATR
jgi:hydrogenase maturation protease